MLHATSAIVDCCLHCRLLFARGWPAGHFPSRHVEAAGNEKCVIDRYKPLMW